MFVLPGQGCHRVDTRLFYLIVATLIPGCSNFVISVWVVLELAYQSNGDGQKIQTWDEESTRKTSVTALERFTVHLANGISWNAMWGEA